MVVWALTQHRLKKKNTYRELEMQKDSKKPLELGLSALIPQNLRKVYPQAKDANIWTKTWLIAILYFLHKRDCLTSWIGNRSSKPIHFYQSTIILHL